MFGESIGIWMIQAMQNNYTGSDKPFSIVECGPGSGQMMEDIIRTVSQFTKVLRNVNIFMVESSENLAHQQQERLKQMIETKLNMFLSYDLEAKEQGRDRFFNKD